MLHDNEGDNISDRNRMYCELTAYYWAWKNDTQADYYGFWHYRRYMSFADRQFPHNPFEDVCIDYLDSYAIKLLNLDENVMHEKISQYDVIATTPVVLKKLNICLKSNRHQYESTPYLSVTLASIAKKMLLLIKTMTFLSLLRIFLKPTKSRFWKLRRNTKTFHFASSILN